MVPNCGINFQTSRTKGPRCCVPTYKTSYRKFFSKQRSDSFQSQGSQLWNSIPVSLRSISGVTKTPFKLYIDSFLQHIPYTPVHSNMTPRPMDPYTCKPSNSLLQWIPLLKQETLNKLPYNRTPFENLLVENNPQKSKQLLADLCYLTKKENAPET